MKARQLNDLLVHNLLFSIPKFINFSANSSKNIYLSILKSVPVTFDSQLLIVRSSAADEDGESQSSAGEYVSLLNVPSNIPEKVKAAVDSVIMSYEKKRALLPDDQVIIQEMVENVSMSGVIFTHDLNTGAPYYVINYDDQSGLTDTVTSGDGEYANRTLFIHRNAIQKLHSQRFIKLMQAVQELEQVMGSKFLDIEFALGDDLRPYLFQVRAITTQPNWNRLVSKQIDETLQVIDLFVKERFKRFDNVYGDTTILGQMPDWNPVEMIGRAPRALSLSLYKTLITDNAWRSAREIMGYHIPIGQPLLVTLAGQPFIDTRLSFHSYLPNTLSSKIGEKLVNHWIDNLRRSPELHDKVEFDIAITAYSFDIDNKIEDLIDDSLNESEKKEFKKAHLEQTMRLVKGSDKGSLGVALKKIEILRKKQFKKNSAKQASNISSLSLMISNCIQYGTIPFSILARHGFIARTILLSLQSIGVITKDEMSQFDESIQTVASNLVDDMQSLQFGELDNERFMARYGHLRPGTYDIMSNRYDQMDDIIKGSVLLKSKNKARIFKFSKQQQEKVNTLLVNNGFDEFSADDLLDYMKKAIIGREYGKFVFTRSVSDMLELISNFSTENGLTRDEISHVPLNSILETSKSSSINNVESNLHSISKLEEERHQISVAIRLPLVLADQEGVYIVPFQVSHPNFITHKKVTAEILILQSEISKLSLKGMIILIEGADPGFDWIFSQEIAGLITKYGGVNSHMAIRCAEFGIPAAIGCGEQRYELLFKSNKVHLDCAAGLINVLH
jgi:glutamine kinase